MTRSFATLLVVALTLALTSCDEKPAGDEASADAADTADAPEVAGFEAPSPDPEAPAELYRIHCSGCHGKDGDGNGETVLDRRPRDFVAGGFAFGNSREQLERTISVGLPGNNPMPGFADKLDAVQMGKVIDHILALGPQRQEASRQERLMVVTERPVVVRGHLGPVKDDGPSHARGLLVGFPGGTSLEYRADDLRLLAVRRGEFVDRVDWSGRGGQGLEPLGTIAKLVNDGDDFAPWSLVEDDGEKPLVAKLRATETRDDSVVLEFDLVLDGETLVEVVERLFVVEQAGGTTFNREVTLSPKRDVIIHQRERSSEISQRLELTPGGTLTLNRGMVIQHTVAGKQDEESK